MSMACAGMPATLEFNLFSRLPVAGMPKHQQCCTAPCVEDTCPAVVHVDLACADQRESCMGTVDVAGCKCILHDVLRLQSQQTAWSPALRTTTGLCTCISCASPGAPPTV